MLSMRGLKETRMAKKNRKKKNLADYFSKKAANNLAWLILIMREIVS